ncbi:hypothetical protein ACGFXC_24315 [Streptomyces sp. NPDC048507]|uniref:hypothetical protein n=1 Tax=Streptomyces sp. NPDC048507 TaxID=3365560 RepID=UPI0037108680
MADGPGGATVGSVNIRVVPDTSKFKREIARLIAWFNGKKLKLDIEADTSKVKAELESLSRDRQIKVKVDADTAAAKAKVAAASRDRKMTIDAVIKDNRLDVGVDEEALKRKIRRALQNEEIHLQAEVDSVKAELELERLAHDRKVKLQADLDDATARMRLAALSGENRHRQVYIQANLDAARARAALKALERRREVDINPDLDNARVAGVAARLAWLTHRREVVITTNIRNNAIYMTARVINGLWRTGTLAFKALGGVIAGVTAVAAGLTAGVLKVGASATAAAAEGSGAFASMAAKITGSLSGMADSASGFASRMGGAFVSMASNVPQLVITLVTLAATFGLVVFVGGALIGVLSAAGAALASLVSSAVGIVGLLGAVAIAMAAAGVAALALAAVPLLPMVGALGLVLLNTDKAKAKFQELRSVLESKVRPAADSMFRAFDKAFDGILVWLDRISPQLQKFFDAGSKFVQPLVDSLTGFVDQVLPRVTSALQESGMVEFATALKGTFIGLGRTFGDFVQLLAQNGAKFGVVIREMGRGIDVVVMALGRFMVNLTNGAASVGKAADGIASFFDELGTRMGRALDTAQFDAFMTHVQEGLRLLGEGVGRWVEEATRHGDDFGRAFEAIAQAFSDSAEPMARFMAAGARVLPTVLDGIGAAMSKVMPALENFMVVWANASPEIMSAIADVLAEILTNLSDSAVVEGIKRMVEVFGQLAVELTKPEMIAALVGLGQNFANLAAALGPQLIDGLARFVDLLTPLAAGMAAANQLMTGDLPGAMDSLGSAWDWLKGKFVSDNEETSQNTRTMFEDLQTSTDATLLAIQQQAMNATQQVAQSHGQMKDGVLAHWSNIQQYTDLINSGIGTAAENAQIRVDAAAAQSEVSWTTHMNTMNDSSKTVFDSLATGSAATADAVALQAERMAQQAAAGAQKGKDGITSSMNGAKDASKSAYDGMSASSRETWDKIVNDARTGTTNMNVTSSQAWNDLAQKIETTLSTAKARIDSHSKEATQALGAVPKDAGGKWPAYANTVQSEANRAANAVQSAANSMKSALNAVTSQTYTINVKVNTTKVVTEINQTASDAQRSAAPQLAMPQSYAMPFMTFAAMPSAFDAEEFSEALPEESLYSSYRSGGALSSAISALTEKQNRPSEPVAQHTVTINANTNADPVAISREVAWQLKRITR